MSTSHRNGYNNGNSIIIPSVSSSRRTSMVPLSSSSSLLPIPSRRIVPVSSTLSSSFPSRYPPPIIATPSSSSVPPSTPLLSSLSLLLSRHPSYHHHRTIVPSFPTGSTETHTTKNSMHDAARRASINVHHMHQLRTTVHHHRHPPRRQSLPSSFLPSSTVDPGNEDTSYTLPSFVPSQTTTKEKRTKTTKYFSRRRSYPGTDYSHPSSSSPPKDTLFPSNNPLEVWSTRLTQQHSSLSSSPSHPLPTITDQRRGTKEIVSNYYNVRTRGSLAASILPSSFLSPSSSSSSSSSGQPKELTEIIHYRTTRNQDVADKRTREYRINIHTTRYHNFLTRLRNGHEQPITCVHFCSAENTYLLAGSKDTTICLWNVDEHTIIHRYTGHTSTVTAVYPSPIPHDSTIVSSSMDGTIKFWRTSKDYACTATLHPVASSTYPIYSIAWSHDGSLIVSTGGRLGNELLIYNIEQLYHDIVVKTTNNTLSSLDDTSSSYLVYRIEGYSSIHSHGHQGIIRKVVWSKHDDYLFSGGDDTVIRIWSLVTPTMGQCISILSGHGKGITDLSVSPGRGTRIVSGSRDGTAKIWLWSSTPYCLLTLNRRSSLSGALSCRSSSSVSSLIGVTAVSFTIEDDGRRIITAYDDGHVYVWNSYTGILYQRLVSLHQGSISQLTLRNDGIGFATASDDTTIGVWYSLPNDWIDDCEQGYYCYVGGMYYLPGRWLRTLYHSYWVNRANQMTYIDYPMDLDHVQRTKENHVFRKLDYLLQHGGAQYITKKKQGKHKVIPHGNGYGKDGDDEKKKDDRVKETDKETL